MEMQSNKESQMRTNDREMDAIMARIIAVKEKLHLTTYAIAKDSGVSNRTLADNFQGRSYPKLPTLLAISKTYNLSLDWLFLGDGPMFRDSPAPELVTHSVPAVADTYTIGPGSTVNFGEHGVAQSVDQTVTTDVTAPAPDDLSTRIAYLEGRLHEQDITIAHLAETNHTLSRIVDAFGLKP